MARPSTISDESILQSARAVFLEKGIRATTAAVARHAGIAEGSIFNRFATKEKLFQASMQPRIEDPAWLTSLHATIGKGNVGENLIAVGYELVQFFRQIMPLVIMSWSNQSELPESLREPLSPPIHALKGVAQFFSAEMKKGRVRRADPEILARMYIGAIQHYVFSEMISRTTDEFLTSESAFLSGLVDIMMTGARPDKERRI